jgi:PAS domain S-box-containing protein
MMKQPVKFTVESKTYREYSLISKRILAEPGLFKQLVELSTNCVLVHLDGRLAYVNPAGAKTFRFDSPEMLIGQRVIDWVHPDSKPDVLARMGEMNTTGKSVPYIEEKMLAADGTVFYAHVGAVAFSFAGKKGALVLLRDITSMKEKELELTHSKRLLEKIFNTMEDAVLLADPTECKIRMCNLAAEKIFGYTWQELIGMSISSLHINKGMYLHFKNTCEDSIQRVGYFKTEFKMRRKSGEIVNTETVVTPISEGTGQLGEVIYMLRDVTEKRREAEQIRRKILLFNLEAGSLYLVKEKTPNLAVAAFKDLIKAGYSGVLFGRPEHDSGEEKYEKYFIGSTEGTLSITRLKKMIGSMAESKAILIERLDYFISHSGFNKVVSMVEDLREIAYLNSHIIILGVNPDLLSEAQMKRLSVESKEVLPMHELSIPSEMKEILLFVHGHNTWGRKPSYSDVAKRIAVSKPTVRKKIRSLILSGYLEEAHFGREKRLILTDKAKASITK